MLNKAPGLNGEIFNFGPKESQNKKVIDVVNEIKKNIPSFKLKIKKTETFKESKLLKLNSSKAKKKLNWKTKLSFRETIEMTSMWYKMYYDKKKISEITLNQIKKFEKKL